MKRQEENLAQLLLPDDVLAVILSRLAPRSLARARCVCIGWRDLIDARRLLRQDLLPCSLEGIFINYIAPEYNFAEFFSRPSAKSINYPPYISVRDHCNGLLLLFDGVLNPATGWWMPLPQCPSSPGTGMERFIIVQDKYLVFDPTVSSNYEVFAIPRVPYKDNPDGFGIHISKPGTHMDTALLGSPWPLSPFILNVWSSMTGAWQKRFFERDGEAAGFVADMQLDERYYMRRRNSVYWRGALYVHCENDYIMRISFSNNMYRMVKPPRVTSDFVEFYLGKSEKGVYYALLDDDFRLWVWILAEPSASGEIEWILKHDSGCGLFLPSLNCVPKAHGPWNLNDVSSGTGDESTAVLKEHKSEWNSDGESILHNEDSGQSLQGYLEILGFHPYREIIFLQRSMRRGLAYHLNSSKLEDLGNLHPNNMSIDDIGTSFPFTPCRIGEFSEENNN